MREKELVLQDDHYNAFGRVIFGYASAESGLKILLSAMLELDLTILLALTSKYNSSNLRDVMKAIGNSSQFDTEEEQAEFFNLVAEFDEFASLRNHIAHSRWTFGEYENTIKPVTLKIQKSKIKPIGYSAGEASFTTEEMFEKANQLFNLNNKIRAFVNKFGYRERIENMISN